MLKKTKFFDVECAYGRAYDLKELRRILEKVIGKRVESLSVMRGHRRSVRAVVDLYDHTEVDFKGIQRDALNERGVILIEVAADGTGTSLQVEPVTVKPSTVPVNIVHPSTIPVKIEVVKRSADAPHHATRRASRSHSAAA